MRTEGVSVAGQIERGEKRSIKRRDVTECYHTRDHAATERQNRCRATDHKIVNID